jgi:hypothetical protein
MVSGSILTSEFISWHFIIKYFVQTATYDHRTLKIRLPVRSAIYKQCTGGLVVRWVTTSESPLLYVLFFLSHLLLHDDNAPLDVIFC